MPAESNLTKEQQQELARCMTPGGFLYFLTKFVLIEDQEKGVIPFELWPCHVEVTEALRQHQFIIILKARQIGMSWLLGAAYPLWLCIFHPHKLALLFSWRDDEAAELVRRARFVWAQLPEWMQPKLLKDNAMELEFAGLGSRILGFPSKPDAGSSHSASYVLSDEHAKQPYAREQYAAIRPTIEHGGQLIMNSTAKGAGTFNYQVWSNAKAGLNNFHPIFFPFSARPGRDAAWWHTVHDSWLDEEIKFFQEYPRTPEEAVQFSVPRFFPVQRLQEPLASFTTPLPRESIAHPLLRRLAGVRASPGCLGVRVYQEPSPTGRYFIGADVSQGIGQDRQAAVVLDALTGEEVAVAHGNWPITTYANLLFSLGQAYGAVIAPEDNNHGHAVIVVIQQLIERARRDGKERVETSLYFRKPLVNKQTGRSVPGQPGWHTGPQSKAVLYDTLYEGLMGDLRVASQGILEECKMVVRDPDTGKIGAEVSFHDDLVIALGIAWMMVVLHPRQAPAPRGVPFGMGPHAQQLAEVSAERYGETRQRPRRKQGDILKIGAPGEKRPTLLKRLSSTRRSKGVLPW